MKQAIILAAGRGSRMMPLTAELPKTMLSVGDKSFIERIIETLIRQDFTHVSIVVGYQHEKLIENLSGFADSITIAYIVNKEFKNTNSLYSLSLALENIDDPFVLFESDIVFDPILLKRLVNELYHTATLLDGILADPLGTIAYVHDGFVSSLSHENDRTSTARMFGHKTLNITKFGSNQSLQLLRRATELTIQEQGKNVPLEQGLKTYLILSGDIKAVMTTEEIWAEIDTPDELSEFCNIHY